jgi:hypothetical protein
VRRLVNCEVLPDYWQWSPDSPGGARDPFTGETDSFLELGISADSRDLSSMNLARRVVPQLLSTFEMAPVWGVCGADHSATHL